jgi:hypothetical protein
VSSEVSRGHSKPETSADNGEVSQKDEGLNVRKEGGIRKITAKAPDNRNTLENYSCEDKPEAESKT